MAERPRNTRIARVLERNYQPKRYFVDENQIGYAYRGTHRAADPLHGEDQSPAERRDSRVGRHHATEENGGY